MRTTHKPTSGFTLVELLVVISIIGMLAGLLLPAVNAAREAGRRATCVNQQGQLALALITYEGNKGQLPPMRGQIGSNGTHVNITSWVGFILPQIELNQLYNNLTNMTATQPDMIKIPVLLCKSAVFTTGEISQMSYVVNGGYQNGAVGSDWASVAAAGDYEPNALSDAVFFDNWAPKVNTTDLCKLKSSLSYVSAGNGGSNTVLLSENLQAREWSYWDGVNKSAAFQTGESLTIAVNSRAEDGAAFSYPINTGISDAPTLATTPKPSQYGADPAVNNKDGNTWSYRGYNISPTDPAYATTYSPAWINDLREGGNAYRTSRPSSNHPGVVVAAFADRSTRPLNQLMDKKIFQLLCSPNSGQVIAADE